MKKLKVSIILPVYDEEKVIEGCLKSLLSQTYPCEIIVIDDGSTDRTIKLVKKFNVRLLKQNHRGYGPACNYGASKAKGDILVFIDADQTCDKDCIKKLIDPILRGEAIGTINTYEYVSNINNIWSRCWNIGEKIPLKEINKRRSLDTNKGTEVYRAILKNKFLKVKGFDENVGYADDRIGKKLGVLAKPVDDAVIYHKNPSSLYEIYKHAVWIGKSSSRKRPFINFIAHLIPISIVRGAIRALKYSTPEYVIFKVVFDFGLVYGLTRGILFNESAK